MNIPETAIQAAAETFAHATGNDWRQVSAPDQEIYLQEARAALEAALPSIEHALRTRIAADIQAKYPEMSHHVLITERRQALYDGMREAARIAEEGATK